MLENSDMSGSGIKHCVAAEGIATEFDGIGSGLNCP
jgi:hypothetical protein